ncbi:hypothetical protein OG625_12970 [Streptomyces sp. NBC_01351]|uniref:hypothetical protein n=1 Tax=Streptomyces sp. NBC_01351 TaxID=2903833 RepID=UPI002E30460A|nr:hypothetical protein [Streptomyces sp. NBC_01351]
MTFTKMTDRSVDASCLLGSVSLLGTAVSAISADRRALLATLPVSERNERPIKASAAVAVEAQAHGAYGPAAAAGAGSQKQTTKQQHHLMWAFRGLEPWSDPA